MERHSERKAQIRISSTRLHGNRRRIRFVPGFWFFAFLVVFALVLGSCGSAATAGAIPASGGIQVSGTVGTTSASAEPGPALPPLPPGDEIYDLRNPRTVPFPWGWYLFRGVVLVLAIWILTRCYRWLIRIDPEPSREEIPVPPPDPLEEALAALRRLRDSSLWREGRYKDICEHLALVFKVFLHDRFDLGIGAASTVRELVSDLRGKEIDPGLCRQVEDLLELFDGVKYAGGDLGGMTLESLHDRILGLIRRGDWQS